MKYFIIIAVLTALSFTTLNFKQQQKGYQRVRVAYKEKEAVITTDLQKKKITVDSLNILINIYKAEKQLELWVKNKKDTSYQLLKSYAICSMSGGLGPKRKQGDYQVPEGFYHISVFNPSSSYYLSMGINYPNSADKILCSDNTGGDIFIHGDCCSIGCVAITDNQIKELYLFALEAFNNRQTKIPVYIFPTRLNSERYNILNAAYADKKPLITLWNQLKKGYDKFQLNHKELEFTTNAQGEYIFH